tara:strand:- start:29472 stop:30431 length:960 start_codon:yes stop_codon:yes gene_type:complete
MLINETHNYVVNVDKLTYASNQNSLSGVEKSGKYSFEEIDICNFDKLKRCFYEHSPDSIIHLAAESHVDRSINSSEVFIKTNILGTYNLLEISREYFSSLDNNSKSNFRFHHVSTDEVYGDLGNKKGYFVEENPYKPSSPYSASKASSDHLVRAWNRTYGLPTIVTNCSNNYGPYQHPEKLIPLVISNALSHKKIPIYGKGSQIRDWLYVEDHAEALYKVLTSGTVGETYNIGGHNEKTNLDVVLSICKILDEHQPSTKIKNYSELINFVDDRPGHDIRYAIDASKIKNELDWEPAQTFETGIKKTVLWYLEEMLTRNN